MGDHHAAFGQDQLDVAQAEAENVIQPHGMADDLGRKPMAAIEGRLCRHPISLARLAPTTPDAVNLAMPSALMTYRTAADLLEQIFPVGAGNDKETMRRHTLSAGAALRDCVTIRPETAAAAIGLPRCRRLDSTFIRSCEDGERHLEVRVGNVETETGGRQVFGAVARSDTDIKVLIRRNLDAIGRTEAPR